MKPLSRIYTCSRSVAAMCTMLLLVGCKEPSAISVETTTASKGESLLENKIEKEVPVNTVLNDDQTRIDNGLDNYFLNQEDNSVISPYGITTALKLVSEGAAQSSKTQLDELLDSVELAATLSASQLKQIDNIGDIWFNKVLVAYGDERNLKDSFRELTKAQFNASEFHLDDAQRRAELNDEISSVSNGWLSLPQMPSVETSSIYIIALNYFSGKWQFPFDKAKSKPGFFYNSDGENVLVTKMNINGEFQYVSDAQYQIVSLPFADLQFEAVVILPSKGSKADIDIPEALAIFDNLREKKLINLSLPRFKAEFDQSLKFGLMKAGVKDLFSPNLADFSNMVKRADGMHVSDIIHRAAIDVSEEGAVAASTTIVSLFGSLPSPKAEVSFDVDRAFYFVIRSRDLKQNVFVVKMVSFQEKE